MIKGSRYINTGYMLLKVGIISLFILAFPALMDAQSPSKIYTIKNGKMYIQVSKHVKEASLDSFISQYALEDLAIKEFIKSGFKDSLRKRGWEIAVANDQSWIFTKPLSAIDNLKDPGDKFRFMENHNAIAAEFPSVSSNVLVGYNKFKK